MKKQLLTLCLLALVLTPFSNYAQDVLMSWQFSRSGSTDVTYQNTYGDFAISGSVLSRGSGFGVSSLARGFSSVIREEVPETDPLNRQKIIDLETAKEHNAYYEFYLDVKPGYKVKLTSIEARMRRSGAGATSCAWAYSTDGENFTDLETVALSGSAENGVPMTIDLSGVAALQDVTKNQRIYFRVYGWGFTTATGSFAFGRVEGDGAGGGASSPAWTTAQKIEATAALQPLKILGTIEENTDTDRLIGWDFKDLGGKEATFESTYTENNMNVSVISKGSGLVDPAGEYTRGMYVSTQTQTSGKEAAKAAGNYYEFTVSSKTDYSFSISSLDFITRRSSAGSRNYVLEYSSDNGVTFNEVPGSEGVLFGQESFYHSLRIDLSGNPAFTNVSSNKSLIFRLIIWGETAATGTFILGRNEVNAAGYGLLVGGSTVLTSTVPVKLTSYNGKFEGNKVKLNWTTASEKNNSHFNILRSPDGKNAILIGTVGGKGDSNTTENYSFTDENYLNGDNYYHLIQYDFDGKTSDEKITVVNTALTQSFINAFATENAVNISLSAKQGGKGTVSITDISGRNRITVPVNTASGSLNIEIPVTLEKGVYIVTYTSGASEKLQVKFIQ